MSGKRDTRGKPASRQGDQKRVEVWNIFQNLKPDGALACNHVWIVER